MKILVLSTIYPASDIKIANNTNVVHYFAKEWVKQGHEVLVIHNYPIYLRLFHWVASKAEKYIASRFNTSVTTSYQSKDVEFDMDGVHVVRMPLFKPLPRFKVPKKNLQAQIEKIANVCIKNDFIPDVITAHNFYPHLPMVNRLKFNYFPKSKTCVVVHKQVWKMLKYCGEDYVKEILKIDIWGYRSLPLKKEFERITRTIPKNFFMCYSGIPIHFLKRNELCSVNKPIIHFVYVGSFIKRKFPETLLMALEKTRMTDFSLDYVGDGANRLILEKIVRKNHWEEKVTLHGFVKREDVPCYISKAQCFIMISKEETFGLVYLEAMSMGCITIASRNEGMEGIIEDGKNGFLCRAGDYNELASIIERINALPQEKLKEISNNAIKTARQLTDSKVAENYIDSIINISN